MADEALGVRAWFFDDPPTVVDQVTAADMSVAIATFLSKRLYDEVVRRHGAAGRKVRFIHDWRAVSTYDAAARDQLIEWGRQSKALTAEAIIALGDDISPFLRIATSTGVSLLRATGTKISITEDLGGVIAPLAAKGS